MSVGRIWRLLLGTALVVVGLILCVIPGPGLPFIFLGGALLASQFKLIARAMDWFELRVRTVAGWALRHWKKLPLWARLVVGAVIVAAGFASMYFFYWFMHR